MTDHTTTTTTTAPRTYSTDMVDALLRNETETETTATLARMESDARKFADRIERQSEDALLQSTARHLADDVRRIAARRLCAGASDADRIEIADDLVESLSTIAEETARS